MLQNLRPIEIILLIAIVLLLFGAKKLPDAARGIGQSLKIFRKELRSEEDPAPAPKMAEQPVPAQAGGESVPAASATQDVEE
ncbi:MAG TPA: twin-arginine translocase TatA/TatE family subunit [Actinomycetales bacterium]|nr:twin-arginine translocase TatA/TatE family subunit [Actinomycetales bacterium]